MDGTYEYALRRRESLKQELDKIEHFLALYAEMAAKNGQEPQSERESNVSLVSESTATEVRHALGVVPEPSKRQPGRVTDNPKPADVLKAVAAILEARGQPMSRRQIYEALAAQGLKIKGEDPLKVLGTNLWRSKDKFTPIEGRGYWLTGRPVPPKPGGFAELLLRSLKADESHMQEAPDPTPNL